MTKARTFLRRFAVCVSCVLAATTVQATPLVAQSDPSAPDTAQSAITGFVFDSTASRPLAGAQLQLARSDDLSQLRTTQADADGRFRFDSLAPGTYLAGATHPRLDSLGIRQLSLLVQVGDSDTLSTTLSVPSIARLIVQYCGFRNFADSSGMLIGKLRQATPDRRAIAGTVGATWAEVAFTRLGLERTTPYRTAETDAAGQFIVCSAPPRGLISLRAWSGADSSGFVDAEVPANGLLLRDLFIGPPVDSTDVAGTLGVVRGTVRRPDGGPMSEVRLSVSSSNTEVISADNGVFTLASLPPGTHTLEARAVGYSPRHIAVDVIAGEVVTMSVDMEKFTALDPVMVRADRLTRMWGLEGFNERRKSGWGYFLDPAQIAQRNPLRVTDLLRRMPGVIIRPAYGIAGAETIRMTGGCRPRIFIDGMPMFELYGNIENVIFATDIRALEVYNRPMTTPPQFLGLNNCGAVLFWTGPRG